MKIYFIERSHNGKWFIHSRPFSQYELDSGKIEKSIRRIKHNYSADEFRIGQYVRNEAFR